MVIVDELEIVSTSTMKTVKFHWVVIVAVDPMSASIEIVLDFPQLDAVFVVFVTTFRV